MGRLFRENCFASFVITEWGSLGWLIKNNTPKTGDASF